MSFSQFNTFVWKLYQRAIESSGEAAGFIKPNDRFSSAERLKLYRRSY